MAYSQNLTEAARRHYKAAQVLYGEAGPGTQPRCRAVAGYLYGIAGELAVKQMMRVSGIRPAPASRGEDPYFAHFPDLKTMLSTATGRRGNELRKLSEDPRLFQNWAIAMRYAPTAEIKTEWVDGWKSSAENLIAKMGIS